MPSASIPKTRFLPAQNPPHSPPFGPPQILSSLASFAQLQLRSLLRLYPSYNRQASIRRVGDASRILPNPTLNYRRADQRHCQKRLLDSGTSPTVHKE